MFIIIYVHAYVKSPMKAQVIGKISNYGDICVKESH